MILLLSSFCSLLLVIFIHPLVICHDLFVSFHHCFFCYSILFTFLRPLVICHFFLVFFFISAFSIIFSRFPPPVSYLSLSLHLISSLFISVILSHSSIRQPSITFSRVSSYSYPFSIFPVFPSTPSAFRLYTPISSLLQWSSLSFLLFSLFHLFNFKISASVCQSSLSSSNMFTDLCI